MTIGKLYKHNNNTDVAFKPLVIFVNHRLQVYKAQGYWINIVNPDKFYIINNEKIEIKISDLPNWVEYES